MKKNILLDRVQYMGSTINITRIDTMKQVFPFLLLLSLCFMVSCDKCTGADKYQHKAAVEKKYPHLTSEETEFASQLSPEHRTIFCEKFNEKQRASAMKLIDINECKRSGTCGTSPKHMSPDQAVEQIYRGHRMHVKEE